MAWIPTDPEMVLVAGPPILRAMDRYKIYDLHVIDSGPSCSLQLRRGYDDGNGNFIVESERTITIPDSKYPNEGLPELVAAMTELADGTKSRRDNTQIGVYEMLEALGELPDGVIEA